MSKILMVCVSMGRVDECRSGANGLRVSGSVGGKVCELGKMKEAFVVKCQGTHESPANLSSNCRRVLQGCLTGGRKGAKRMPEGCKRVPKGHQHQSQWAKGSQQDPPRRKVWTAVLRKSIFWSKIVARSVDFGNHFGSTNGSNSVQKMMPWQDDAQMDPKYWKHGSQTDAKSMHSLERGFCPKHVFSNYSRCFFKIEGSKKQSTNHQKPMWNCCSKKL